MPKTRDVIPKFSTQSLMYLRVRFVLLSARKIFPHKNFHLWSIVNTFRMISNYYLVPSIRARVLPRPNQRVSNGPRCETKTCTCQSGRCVWDSLFIQKTHIPLHTDNVPLLILVIRKRVSIAKRSLKGSGQFT